MCCARTAALQGRRRMLGRTTSFLQQFKRNPQEIQAKYAGVRHSWHDMRMSCPMMTQEPPRGFKIDPRRLQNRSSEAPKSSQDHPDGGQERPRAAQECPRASQERPRSASRAPQERPRAPQERPRAPQDRPKCVQEGPKTPLKALRRALGVRFDAYKLEKRVFRERSAARLARKASSERFFVDFRSVRARANM